MVGKEDIVLRRVVSGFKNILMPDTKEKIPDVCPDLRHIPDQVSSLPFSKQRKDQHQWKSQQSEKDEPEQGVESVELA
jgi:hypothetical protein